MEHTKLTWKRGIKKEIMGQIEKSLISHNLIYDSEKDINVTDLLQIFSYVFSFNIYTFIFHSLF